MRRLSLLNLLLLIPALCALVIGSDAGDANTRAPAQVPGWANVGLRAAMTAIYLGNGWVITARHVGAGDVVFGGVSYPALLPSTVQIGAGAGAALPDLIAFRIAPRPELPALRIRPTRPDVGDRAVLVGAGPDRGERTRWNGHAGWFWGPHGMLRWGTNRVHQTDIEVRVGDAATRAFTMRFDLGETPYEAQAAIGDSGGAVFIRREGRFELAGVLIAVAGFPGQPPGTALFGNFTTAADLSVHHRTLTALLRDD